MSKKWVGNPRQDFWQHIQDAIEEKSGGVFRTQRKIEEIDYPHSTRVIKEGRTIAYVMPRGIGACSPVDLNKPDSTYWYEVKDSEWVGQEDFYQKILSDFGIKLSEIYAGEPFW